MASTTSALMSAEPTERSTGRDLIRKRKLIVPYWEKAEPKEEAVALAVVRAVVELSYPPPEHDWERGPEDLLMSILGSGQPSVLAYVGANYGRAEEQLRLYLLTLVASAGSRQGAEVLVRLTEEHGWPAQVHRRFFSELRENMDHADVLFPALLNTEGYPQIELGDVLLSALRMDRIQPAAVADTELSRGLTARLDALLAKLTELREADEEGASRVARELAMKLDLAGFVGDKETIAPTLQRAAALPESWPAAFAVASLIRRGEEVAEADIARIAGDHSTRNALYSLLDGLDATARIPEPLRSRDAFAAADMVEWLSHPGELGRPPDAIEQMEVYDATRDGEPVVLYVWRFRTGDDPWLAAVSGIYPAAPPEGPLGGNDTFSRFEAWDSQSAEQHALAILDNLAEWHRAWAARDAD